MKELFKISVFALMGVISGGFSSPQAVARPTIYTSIELITADAEVVVRGIITEIGSADRQVNQPHHWSNHYRSKAVIRVIETLKGPKTRKLEVRLHDIPSGYRASLEGGKELLFSLQPMDDGNQPSPMILRPRHGQSVIELDGSGPGVATMDFRLLTSRENILEAARRGAVAAPRGGELARQFLIPPTSTPLMKRPFSGYNATIVVVPVDAKLEEMGEQWAKSNSMEYRCLAPLALQHFKSEKNIALLRKDAEILSVWMEPGDLG